jgi:hypothetical protein
VAILADRSVTVRLLGDVKPFIAALAKAEAAAKKFRDGLGDPFEPYDKEQQKRERSAPKEGDQVAGAFARGFARRLESAFKSLPKAKIDADSSEAQTKLQEVRAALETLASKRIGLDIDASSAFAEMASLRAELDRLSQSADVDIRADTQAASTQLQALQREIDQLGDSEPIRPDVDTSSARQQLEDLQQRMAELNSRTIGVDLDAGAARAEIAAIERELQQLNTATPDIDIRIDSTTALADLHALESQLSSVAGRSTRVHVDADVGGALVSIGMVGAALASLPAVTAVAVSVGVLGGALTAAGVAAAGFAAVAGPSMGRINEALKAQESAAKSAGAATGGAGQSAAQAAQQALQLEAAEKRLADAQRDERQAQEDLTRAREAGRRALEDMNFSLERSVLSQKDAALAVREAEARLSDTQARHAEGKASSLELERAMLGVEQAQQRAREQEVKTQRAKKDTAVANKAGIEGTKEYKRGLDDLKQSQDKVAQAEMQLKQLHLQQQAAMSSGGGGAAKLADAFAGLSKQEKALAKDVKVFKDAYVDWQRSLQPDVFPAIRSGMDLMSTGMKISTPLIKAGAGAFDDFLKQANKELKSEQWKSFFDDLTEQAPRAIDGLTDSAMNVAGGLTGVLQAFLPYTDQLMDFLEEATQGFEDWGQSLGDSPEFEAFLAYVAEQGPKVAEILGNVAEFVGKVMQAGGNVAPGVLDFLVTLSDKLAGMDPGQIQAIATGVGLIFAAVKLGATLKIGALVLLAEVLSKMSPGQIQAVAIAVAAVVTAVKGYQLVTGVSGWLSGLTGGLDKAGKSADGAKGKLGAVTSLFKGGVITTAIAGTAIAFDAIGDAIDGLNPDMERLAVNLGKFGESGQLSQDVLDQLGPKMSGFVGQFESFGDSAARLASDNPLQEFMEGFTGFIDSNLGVQLDSGRQGIDNLDKALANMVGSGNTQGAAEAFKRLSDQAINAGVPVSKLKELFPQYAQSMDGVPATTGEVGHAIELLGGHADGTQRALGEAKKRMDDWKTSLDAFNGQTDAAAAVREMETAYKDVKTAIADANGKLELTPGLTGKQRDAVIEARDAFAGYLEKVKASSDAQETLTGRTGEARDAVLKQLPALSELAGGNESARKQVLELARAYGISEGDAKKAAKGGDDLLEVLAKLKSKDIRIGVDMSGAEKGIESFIARYSNKSLALAIYAKVKARGGISDARGVELMAAGGLRPMVRDQATLVPGGGGRPDTVFAEAGREAYIPYDAKYRDRALAILSQVASDFGLQVYGEQATEQVSAMQVTISDTGVELADGLTSTVDALTSTMGQAGSLTSSITQVGATAEQLKAGWVAGSQVLSNSVTLTGQSVTGWGKVVSVGVADMSTSVTGSIGGLGKEVVSLGDVIAKAADVVRSVAAAKSKATGSSSSKSTPTGSKGAIIGGPGPMGSEGAVIGYVPPLSAAPAPLNPHSSGVSGGTAGSSGWNTPTNSSRVSAPQQMSSSSSYTSQSSGGAAPGGDPFGGGSGSSGGGSMVTIGSFHATPDQSPHDIAQELAWIGR